MTQPIPDLNRTPLYDFHLKHNARMVPFAGWEMPVQYAGIVQEHKAVRSAAGLFDVSHMGEARVSGSQSLGFLNYMMTNDLLRIKPGGVIYSPMCYPSGGVVDDLLVNCVDEGEYLLCLNASNKDKDVAWLNEHVGNFDCVVEDVSSKYCQLALQGPLAVEVLSSLVDGVEEVKRFNFKEFEVLGYSVLVSRTGYTGEDGFEVYGPPEAGVPIAEALLEIGSPKGLCLVGLGARDTLRLEAGYTLYGHEISADISPVQAGLNFAVKLGKEKFIGKEALVAQKEKEEYSRVIFYKLEDRRIARQGARIYCGDRDVGEVLSGTQSPSLLQPIGSALVSEFNGLEVDVRGHRIPLLLIKPPFVQ